MSRRTLASSCGARTAAAAAAAPPGGAAAATASARARPDDCIAVPMGPGAADATRLGTTCSQGIAFMGVRSQ
jgi:hypothetical protein